MIVTLSTGITFLTALSISAIATDQHVRIGGTYYLLRTSLAWRGATVTVKMVVSTPEAAEGVRRNLQSIVHRSRTRARCEVLVREERSFETILRESSGDADLVFLGMAEPTAVREFRDYYEKIQERAPEGPTNVFVLAAEDLAFGKVLLQEQ